MHQPHGWLAHHAARAREWLIAHADAELEPGPTSHFDTDCRRRADGVPLAYLTGTREFHGLTLQVNPSVLVPRPETECLADWAIEILRSEWHGRPAARVIDLGTGSGALALAIAAACPSASITATDVSAAALDIARTNASSLNLAIRLAQGDWWQAVFAERFDLALANPPYIAPGDTHLAALRHEPADALVAEDNGLAALKAITGGAASHLSGWLMLEHGWNQADGVRALLLQAGFTDIQTRHDFGGQPRCTAGRIEGCGP